MLMQGFNGYHQDLVVSIFWLSLSFPCWLHSQVSDGGWMTGSKLKAIPARFKYTEKCGAFSQQSLQVAPIGSCACP